MIGPLPSDVTEETMLERGSTELREAIEAVRAGRDPETRTKLLWSLSISTTVRDPDSRSSAMSKRFGVMIRDKVERAETQRTMRDPCPKCGTRMDIGCAHVKHLISGDMLMSNPQHVNAAWERAVRLARGEE